jgi:hypothetical protein
VVEGTSASRRFGKSERAHTDFGLVQRASEHEKATGWWFSFLTQSSVFLIERNAELLAEHGFHAFEIFFHENKLFLDVRKALQEFIESFGQFI